MLEKSLKRLEEAKNGHADGSSSQPTAAAADANAGANTRPFTDEQDVGAKRILQAAKKSHYEVLGLAKTATEADVKKAYRKLALKYHPDKNSAPSAEGAFKAISSAFECLGDSSKREVYDQYGGTENSSYQAASGRGGGGGGGSPFGRHPQEMSPEELFNMFFHGGMGGMGGAQAQGFRMHFGGAQRGHNREAEAQPHNPFQQLLSFLPIILLFLMSFSPFSSQAPERVYSFSPDQSFSLQRETKMAGVTPMIPYYVTEKFKSKYGRSVADLFRVEKAVEREFKETKLSNCFHEQQSKSKRITRSRWERKSKEVIDRIISESTPSCEEYATYFGAVPTFG